MIWCKRSSAEVTAYEAVGKSLRHPDATTKRSRRGCANDSLKHKGNGTPNKSVGASGASGASENEVSSGRT